MSSSASSTSAVSSSRSCNPKIKQLESYILNESAKSSEYLIQSSPESSDGMLAHSAFKMVSNMTDCSEDLNDVSTIAVRNSFKRYDHAKWYVSNSKQTASYFMNTFGFKLFAYKGLETGCKTTCSYVVKSGDIIFEFISPLYSQVKDNPIDNAYIQSIHCFLKKHGDGVKDISFEVEDVEKVFENAIRNGVKCVSYPHLEQDDLGSVKSATIEVFDDINHTFIERCNYDSSKHFLPGYISIESSSAQFKHLADGIAIKNLPPVDKLVKIDHCVQNENWFKMFDACKLYKRIFGFHKFWSVDEKDVATEFSALRSIVMASENEEIKMPINEPAKGLCKSQIEEFLDFYDGPGVQHIAILTDDIIETVGNMKLRGAEFISVPKLYYEKLLPKLLKSGLQVREDLTKLEELGILIDFDSEGYLLQLFTKPLSNRPTVFLEIIQRNNHNGFGQGNFRALFETIEQEQRLRGTLEWC